jgi:acyl-CoA synthetase (AMP-forming)/AMP-acid ligase II
MLSEIHETLPSVLLAQAAKTPNLPCCGFEGKVYSYEMVANAMNRLAGYWASLGIRAGDRVAVLCPPNPVGLIGLLAAMRLGAIFVGINPRYTSAEMARLVCDARPSLILSQRVFEQRNFEAEEEFWELPSHCTMQWFSSIDDLSEEAKGSNFFDDVEAKEAAAMVYTSGTTGTSKGALLSHYGILKCARIQAEQFRQHFENVKPRLLANLPLNHVGGLVNHVSATIVVGGYLHFQEKFDADQAWQLIEEQQLNVLLQVPTMLHYLDQARPSALPALKLVCWGGGKMSATLVSRLQQWAVPLRGIYGLTECLGGLTYSDPNAAANVLSTTVGRPDPNLELRIVDEQGAVCASGKIGEIYVRGDFVFLGYFNNRVATLATIAEDGAVKTGDLAYIDGDGLVNLVGRRSEMIKTGGYNVYPREVEEVLEANPSVALCAVVSIPHAVLGESVLAFVVSHKGLEQSAESLTAWCKTRLAGFKVPKSFVQEVALPLLGIGKVDKVLLRQKALANSEIYREQ